MQKYAQQQIIQLLPRLVALKDVSPLILLLSSSSQSAKYLLFEFAYKHQGDSNVAVVVLSFETTSGELTWLTGKSVSVLKCHRLSIAQIHDQVRPFLDSPKRTLILIDTLDFILPSELTSFIVPLIRQNSSLVVVTRSEAFPYAYPVSSIYTPSLLAQLNYLATTIISVHPYRESNAEMEYEEIQFKSNSGTYLLPFGSHARKCRLDLVQRRKSGRAVEGSYVYDFDCHTFTYLSPRAASSSTDDSDNLAGDLTTFNLGTTEKQRLARDQVELPYMKAQEDETAVGTGAIVYQFEKDDDYDEEDPYEDPF
ncbi:Elongator complex protein 5 [Lipomyces oligophaga]|uniref:Elongator complex protein 5 n=1 Tax=Lipomyces oligophaga TaxID=45792 RepID=UPI0034CFC1CF